MLYIIFMFSHVQNVYLHSLFFLNTYQSINNMEFDRGVHLHAWSTIKKGEGPSVNSYDESTEVTTMNA
jgi:hypothetical protein